MPCLPWAGGSRPHHAERDQRRWADARLIERPVHVGPLPPDDLPVPAQQRLRPDGQDAPPGPRQALAQQSQDEAIAWSPGHAPDLAPEAADLVPDGQSFNVPCLGALWCRGAVIRGAWRGRFGGFA
jgi:hypothetical protein